MFAFFNYTASYCGEGQNSSLTHYYVSNRNVILRQPRTQALLWAWEKSLGTRLILPQLIITSFSKYSCEAPYAYGPYWWCLNLQFIVLLNKPNDLLIVIDHCVILLGKIIDVLHDIVLKSVLSLVWASLDVLFFYTVNINFLTILDHFWDLLKRFKKSFLGLGKRF